MGNYTVFWMLENPRRGRQARNIYYNKCSENSRSQIVFRTDIFRKLTLDAPDHTKNKSRMGAIRVKRNARKRIWPC